MKILKIILIVALLSTFSCSSDGNTSDPLMSKVKGKWKCVATDAPLPESNQYTLEFLAQSNFNMVGSLTQSGRYSISTDSLIHFRFKLPSQYDYFKKIISVTSDTLILNGCDFEGCPEVFIKENP